MDAITPSEIMDRVITDPRMDFDAQLDAIHLWTWLAENVRSPGKVARDALSEPERDRLKEILRVVLESIDPRGGVS